MSILREEAEHEAEVRRRAAAGLETQGDLGLDGRDPRQPLPRTRRALAPETETWAGTAAEPVRPRVYRHRHADDADPRHGSELLPDIEEINSSLGATEGQLPTAATAHAPGPDLARRRKGFRVGFFPVLGIVVALIVAYAYAPQIVDRFPVARPYVADFVDWANAARDQMDLVMGRLVALVDGAQT